MKRQNAGQCHKAVILKKIVKGKEIYKMNGFFLFTKVENYAIIKNICALHGSNRAVELSQHNSEL